MAKVKMVRCYDCKHGKYMQWMKNPIICECTLNDERFVAEAKRICTRYEHIQRQNEPEITHYDHY